MKEEELPLPEQEDWQKGPNGGWTHVSRPEDCEHEYDLPPAKGWTRYCKKCGGVKR